MMQENDAEFNDAGSVKMMQNLPQQLFLNDAGRVKMMQNLQQQLFLNDAGSVTYHNGVNVEPRRRRENFQITPPNLRGQGG